VTQLHNKMLEELRAVTIPIVPRKPTSGSSATLPSISIEAGQARSGTDSTVPGVPVSDQEAESSHGQSVCIRTTLPVR
jgi:hypothetical protein